MTGGTGPCKGGGQAPGIPQHPSQPPLTWKSPQTSVDGEDGALMVAQGQQLDQNGSHLQDHPGPKSL